MFSGWDLYDAALPDMLSWWDLTEKTLDQYLVTANILSDAWMLAFRFSGFEKSLLSLRFD